MKNNILTFIIALAAAFTAANAGAASQAPVSTPDNGIGEFLIDASGRIVAADAVPLAATDSEEEAPLIDYHYCGDPATALATGDGGDIENSAAIMLPDDIVTRYAGAEIVSVTICSGFNRQNPWTNNITDATVFLNYDIFNEADFYTQRGRLSRTSETWSEIKFSKPYKLEAGKPVYVGYRVIRPTTFDCPFAADRIPIESKYSFWVNYSLNGERRWENWAPQYGSLCMHVKLRGSTLPVNDVEVMALNVPMQVDKGSFSGSFRFRNLGATDVTSISYSCSVGENAKVEQTYTLPEPVKFSEAAEVPMTLKCADYGLDLPVTLTVTAVNGTDDPDYSNNTQTGQIICLDTSMGFVRRFVMEEGTGLWCSNCPRGLGTMEYMNERYPDTFIGIGIHQNDAMQISDETYPGHAYMEHLMMLGAYPNARYNRNDSYGNSINDFGSHVEGIYKKVTAMPAVADITAQIYFNDEEKTQINVETNTRFALDTQTPFRIALVLLENNVGPYRQSNGYAGAPADCGGWESMPGMAPYHFPDVARYIDHFKGADGSLPLDKKEKTDYAYSSLLPTKPLKSLDDFDVAVLLINGKSGVIENAVKCHGTANLPVKPSTGIDPTQTARATVEAVAGGLKVTGNRHAVKVYRLNGTTAACADGNGFIALPAGLYVVSVDGVHSKVLVK